MASKIESSLPNNKIHSVMNGAPIPCALNNEHGEITFLNKAFINTLGYTLEDIPDLDHWWPTAYPNTKNRANVQKEWSKRISKAKDTNTVFEPMELTICCKDGTYKTFIVSASELESEFKDEHLVTLFDITDRINLEKEKKKKEKDYLELFESSEVSILNEDLSELFIEAKKIRENPPKNIRQHLTSNLDYCLYLLDKIKIINTNNATLKMFEANISDDFFKHLIDSFTNESLNVFIDEFISIINQEGIFRSEVNFKTLNGNIINTIISVPIPSTLEESKLVPVTIFDITTLKKHKKEIEYQSKILDSIAEGVYFVGKDDGIIKFTNSRFNNIFGYKTDDLTGKHVSTVNAPSLNPEKVFREISNHLLKYGHWFGEVKNIRKNGEEFWSKASVSEFNHPNFGPIWISIHEDISEKKEKEEIIWKQGNLDPLCNIPNRNLFIDWVKQEVIRSERNSTKFSLLFIDLDNFKEVNDTLGHNVGDKLLIQVSERLKQCIRNSDDISRFGGDEFTILIPHINDISDIEAICEKIIESMSKEFKIGHESVFTSVSIGVSSYPSDSKNITTLFKYADQAMYRSKKTGKNCTSYFTKDLQNIAKENRKINQRMRIAVKDKSFNIHYQPIVCLNTNKIIKAEALIRWHDIKLGDIPPSKFIPLAEKNKLIIEIGDWVFNQVVETLKKIRETHKDFSININNSPIQFEDSKSGLDLWPNVLSENNLPGKSICIEITENMLLKTSRKTLSRLNDLNDYQIPFALDDFGTGYSSLSYLTKFNLDYIKIDRSFVKNIDKNPNDLILCKSIISMSHSLGKKVVAEGIESKKQRDLLKAANCDYAQGYYYHKAMPLVELLTVLNSQ